MSQRRLSPIAINVAVWIGLTALVALFGLFSVLHSSSISSHAQSTQASIVGLVPEQHQSFDYRYRVGDRTYFGRSTAGNADRAFESLHVGDTLTVFYDSTDPDRSTAGPPDMPKIEAIGGLVAACAIVPFALMYVMHRARILPYWKLFTPKA
jgi:hypothetical protein